MKKLSTLLILFFVLVSGSFGFSQDIPEGFTRYRIRVGDTLSKIAPQNQWEIIMRVNKVDEKHLPLGGTIFVPDNVEKAIQFLPLSADISREYGKARLIHISLKKQFFGVYEGGKLIFWGPVSSGRKEYGTPAGNYKVLWKAKKYRSKKYDLPMPYAINISNNGIFLHQQSLSGKPASHGCVRLLREDAKKLFGWANKNDAVVIE